MRTELLTYFKNLKLKNFGVSEELPFTSSNTVLYLKNPKKVYTDLKQVSTETLIPILGDNGVLSEIHTVRVYFSTDAKNLPSDYETVLSALRDGKTVTTTTNYFRREVDTITSFENDLMVTELEFRFTKLS